jgi:hypothetical protein
VQRGQHIARRIALAALAAWGLLMIVPDFYRVAYPLASVGFAVDNDGLVFDVKGPFAREEDSPAWRAGLRLGDRLDLQTMGCRAPTKRHCADLLAMLGGMGGQQLVKPGRVLQLQVVPGDGSAARAVEIAAQPYESRLLERGALLANEIIATLFILAAAWLVWTRPGAMTWGFFLYAIWFNSGQDDVFYAFLQDHPRLLLAQEALGAVMEGVGYAGFLVFVLRAPSNRADPHWRGWRLALPLVALVSIGLQLLSYANVYGMPSEMTSRASFLFGFGVDAAAILILLRKRRGQPPQDYQRLRWILWGCLIGLPAFIVAALLQSTTVWRLIPGVSEVPPDLIAVLYLLHGAMAWFVFEAVRRPRVVNVSIPLRRITVFGLMLSVPALFLHQQIEPLNEWLHLPNWGFFALGAVLLFLIGRAHEIGVEFADHVFNRAFRRKIAALRAFADDVLSADSLEAVEAILAEAPLRTLDLASAAVFRRDGAVFKRCAAHGWPEEAAECLDINDPALLLHKDATPFAIGPDDAARLGLPVGLAAPTLAAPVADRLACHALALYGPHAMGAELSHDEGKMLARLASAAALAYRHLGAQRLREQIAALQGLVPSDAQKR